MLKDGSQISGLHNCIVVVVWLLSHIRLFATLWIAACQASLSFTNPITVGQACCYSTLKFHLAPN